MAASSGRLETAQEELQLPCTTDDASSPSLGFEYELLLYGFAVFRKKIELCESLAAASA